MFLSQSYTFVDSTVLDAPPHVGGHFSLTARFAQTCDSDICILFYKISMCLLSIDDVRILYIHWRKHGTRCSAPGVDIRSDLVGRNIIKSCHIFYIYRNMIFNMWSFMNILVYRPGLVPVFKHTHYIFL